MTGRESGLCVLDIDGLNGRASLHALGVSGQLPNTVGVLSGRIGPNGGRSGWHRYFEYPSGADIRNSTGRLGLGLDVRGGRRVRGRSTFASCFWPKVRMGTSRMGPGAVAHEFASHLDGVTCVTGTRLGIEQNLRGAP